MALDPVRSSIDPRLRRLCPALRNSDPASRMKAAAGRYIRRIGHDIAEADIGHAEAGFRRQHTVEQRSRVGMPGGAEQRIGCRHFDIKMCDDHLFQRDQIVILNVAAITAQRGSDSVSSG